MEKFIDGEEPKRDLELLLGFCASHLLKFILISKRRSFQFN